MSPESGEGKADLLGECGVAADYPKLNSENFRIQVSNLLESIPSWTGLKPGFVQPPVKART